MSGLTPDVAVDVPADNPAGNDPVLDRAIEILTGATGSLPALQLRRLKG